MMEQYFYSPSNDAFYLSSEESNYRANGNWPDDLLPVTKTVFEEFSLFPTPPGKDRMAGSDGMPEWVDIPPPPPYVPQQVTRAQGKAALITSGLWDDVLSYVDSITDPQEKALAQVALNDTTHWQRSSPFLNSAAVALGLSDEDLDNLFIQASEIEL